MPLEIRQAIGAGAANNINSGGRIEPKRRHESQFNPSARHKAVPLGHLTTEQLPDNHCQDRQAGEGHADGCDCVKIAGCVHVNPLTRALLSAMSRVLDFIRREGCDVDQSRDLGFVAGFRDISASNVKFRFLGGIKPLGFEEASARFLSVRAKTTATAPRIFGCARPAR
jgi:hypothetical protein